MMNFEMMEIFEDIFWTVAEKYGIHDWWELFDSEKFDEVDKRVSEAFDEPDVQNVPFYCDWCNEMAMDL